MPDVNEAIPNGSASQEDCKVRGQVHISAVDGRILGPTSPENMDLTPSRWRIPLGDAVWAFVGVLAAVALLSVFGAPHEPALEAAAAPLETFVGIPPVAYLVERIGGPHVRAEVLVRAGQDPHTFEPTPRQVVRLSRAKLFFKIGMPFEEHLAEHIAAGPTPIRVVDTAAGIARRTGEPGCACAHGHAHEHEHEPELGDHEHEPEHGADGCSHEAAGDPHLWLSPPLLKRLAANVARALGEADPRHAAFFQANLALLAADLDALDRRIAARLAPCRGRAFYVFHPAFGYFADRYDLRQESVEIEGKPPTPRQLFGLVNKARNDGVKIVFLQSQFNQQVAASVAQAIGGTVASLDSLAYDVPANLDEVAEKIAAAGRDPHVSPCAADCGAEHACHEEDP